MFISHTCFMKETGGGQCSLSSPGRHRMGRIRFRYCYWVTAWYAYQVFLHPFLSSFHSFAVQQFQPSVKSVQTFWAAKMLFSQEAGLEVWINVWTRNSVCHPHYTRQVRSSLYTISVFHFCLYRLDPKIVYIANINNHIHLKEPTLLPWVAA